MSGNYVRCKETGFWLEVWPCSIPDPVFAEVVANEERVLDRVVVSKEACREMKTEHLAEIIEVAKFSAKSLTLTITDFIADRGD